MAERNAVPTTNNKTGQKSVAIGAFPRNTTRSALALGTALARFGESGRPAPPLAADRTRTSRSGLLIARRRDSEPVSPASQKYNFAKCRSGKFELQKDSDDESGTFGAKRGI